MGINILPPQNTPVFEKSSSGELVMRRPWVLFFQQIQVLAKEAAIAGSDVTAPTVNANKVLTDDLTVANELRAGTWTADAGAYTVDGYLTIKDKNGNERKLVTRA